MTHGGGSKDDDGGLDTPKGQVGVGTEVAVTEVMELGVELAAVELVAQADRVVGREKIVYSDSLGKSVGDIQIAIILEEALALEAHAEGTSVRNEWRVPTRRSNEHLQ